MKISFATKQPKADALVVGVFANRVLSNTAAEIDKACKGALRRAMRAIAEKVMAALDTAR